MAMPTSLSTLSFLPSSTKHASRYLGTIHPFVIRKRSRVKRGQFVVRAATEGSTKSSKSDEKIPSWARPDSDEPPPWERDVGSGSSSQSTIQIPFYAYLLTSAITAIAAIGSVFEYVNQKPVFGVVNSDSIFYAPLLGFFALTGIPTSAFLWYKSVQVANKEAEEQDRRDGSLEQMHNLLFL